MLSEQPDIRAIFKEPSFEELKVALARYLDPDAKDMTPVAKEEPMVTKSASPTATKSAELKSTSVKNMIDEFDEVFN